MEVAVGEHGNDIALLSMTVKDADLKRVEHTEGKQYKRSYWHRIYFLVNLA